MSLDRPTLRQLDERIRADIEARFPGADSRLKSSALGVLGRAMAGAMHGAYGFLANRSRQQLPDTAEGEYLDRHASIWGVGRKAAEVAAGAVGVTGAAAAEVPAGTALQRSDGVEYVTTADAVLDGGGDAVVAVEAAEPGAAGVCAIGVKLGFVSPVEGVDALATVSTAITGGADEESDEELRVRLLDRIRTPPEGGALGDYKRWTAEVAGVTRVWVFPGWMGAGSVGVTFAMDGREDPIPAAGDLATVEAHLTPLAPVTAELVVFAPIATPVELEISSLQPSTAAVKAAIQAELQDLFFREASPGGTIPVSHVREAISLASGEFDHELVTATDIVMGPAELAILGEITWS